MAHTYSGTFVHYTYIPPDAAGEEYQYLLRRARRRARRPGTSESATIARAGAGHCFALYVRNLCDRFLNVAHAHQLANPISRRGTAYGRKNTPDTALTRFTGRPSSARVVSLESFPVPEKLFIRYGIIIGKVVDDYLIREPSRAIRA